MKIFPALQNRNYVLYFLGQLISLIGTWLQVVAEGWLVLQLTHSAFWVGLIAALATFPALLFSLFGGVIVDRYPKKKILIITQITSMILALILGVLTITGKIQVWEIAVMAFLLGTITAIDNPARQALVPEMVSKDELPSAIALNAGTYNASRVIGPAVAGLLIAWVGTGGAYIANGLSYIAAILTLLLMTFPEYLPKHHDHPIDAIKLGISYSFKHPLIKTLLIFVGVISIFGWPYTTILPVIAERVFHVGAQELGYLYMAGGIGALGATVAIAAYGRKISQLTFIIGGNTLFAISLIIFTYTHAFVPALIMLFFAGFGLLSAFATMNSTIQHLVANEYRGRVMSIYTLMFLGLSPIGNFQIGWLSERFDTDMAIRIGAVVVLLFGVYVFLIRDKILASYRGYQSSRA